MSSLPERISIKRRRQEEPIETLYLEHGSGNDRKRRVTDFYFQRLSNDVIAPTSLQPHPPESASSTNAHPGIPAVRWTKPGDDRKDFEKLKASLQEKLNSETVNIPAPGQQQEVKTQATDTQSAPSTPTSSDKLQQVRRFHLARHLSSVLSPNSSGGIRKQKSAIRPPLATFVERQTGVFGHEQSRSHGRDPVDKILEAPNANDTHRETAATATNPTLEELQTSKRTTTQTFLRASQPPVKRGISIRDHPSTWNHDSEQLADELAALAMEMDPDVQRSAVAEAKPAVASTKNLDDVDNALVRDDEYVYETYIRVRQEDKVQAASDAVPNFGVLVIDSEDEELWQKYIDSDDDTDWDEEDSNAEDNPTNDYPEDEVSSDDEFGHNPYQYRQHGSDDEAFNSDYDD